MELELPKQRNLFFSEQVDQKTILELSKSIIEINEHDLFLESLYVAHSLKYDCKPIKIYIDTYGGYVYQILGLIGIIEKSKTPVHTIVTGCAISAGFMLLISGHKRYGYEHSTSLYHQVSSLTSGKIQDMKEDIIEIERLQAKLESIILRKTKISKEQLYKNRLRKKDWWITAKQGIKLSVIDEII